MKRYTILASVTEAKGVGDPDVILVDKTVDVGEHVELEKLARSVLMEELGLRDLVYAEVRQTVRQRLWRACGLADSPPADDAAMASYLLEAGAACVGMDLAREKMENSIRHDLLRLDNLDVRWEDPASADAFVQAKRPPVEVRILEVKHGPEAAAFESVMLATRAREIAEYERGTRAGEQAERRRLWALLKLEGEPSENSEHVVIQALDQLVQRRLDELKHYEAADDVGPVCENDGVASESAKLLLIFTSHPRDEARRRAQQVGFTALEIELGETLVKTQRERNALAKGIADATMRAGICNGEVPLTGPDLLLLLDDLAAAKERADIEEERHEYVRAYHCGPDNGPRLVLRSEALARAISVLERWPQQTSPGYLHEIDSETGWWRACDAPVFSLPEKVEDDIVEEIGHAMDARDMAGALEVVRRVLDTTTRAPATEKPYTANDAASVRQDVVRFLRPVLANLRAAMGLPALEREPVHQHELHNELQDLAQDIDAARNAALWLAAWNAQTNDVRGFFLARLAERGGIGFDLASLMSSWYRYRRSLTSDITMSEVETFAKRLRGDD